MIAQKAGKNTADYAQIFLNTASFAVLCVIWGFCCYISDLCRREAEILILIIIYIALTI